MPEPIWKDTTYTGLTSFGFEILEDGSVIYEGYASAYPDGVVRLNVGPLVEHRLHNNLPDFSSTTGGTFTVPEACRTYSLQSGGTQLHSWQFIYDWSYEDFNPTLSDPVNGHLDSRMKLLYSAYKSSSSQICIV